MAIVHESPVYTHDVEGEEAEHILDDDGGVEHLPTHVVLAQLLKVEDHVQDDRQHQGLAHT